MSARGSSFIETDLYGEYKTSLQRLIRRVPAHLIREEDMRGTLRDVAIERPNGADFHDVLRYLPEASDKVDVRVQVEANGPATYIEFKLWHSTIKLDHNGKYKSRSQSGLLPHLRDLVKLAGLAVKRPKDEFLFFSLTQTCRHPKADTSALRWGPFVHTPGNPDTDAQRLVQELYKLKLGSAWVGHTPAFSMSRKTMAATECQIRLLDRWEETSGGGDDWGCGMDFHAFRVSLPSA